jgi:hypothetical protein
MNTRTFIRNFTLLLGALGVLALGADHLYEYAANEFSSVPTIGTLFLLNFIAATVVGVGLLLPLGRLVPRMAAPVKSLLAIAGIGIAVSSLVGLWISEQSGLFGFMDHGFRTTIVVGIATEAVAALSLSAYLGLAGVPWRRLTAFRTAA